MTYVVDASMALSWCFPDEATPRTEALLDQLREAQGFVPQVWALEVTNVLLSRERSKRYSEAEVFGMLEILARLPLRVDIRTSGNIFTRILQVARAQGLTTYDASYVELALRVDLPLASNDREMRDAAASLGIEVL